MLELANAVFKKPGLTASVDPQDVAVLSLDKSAYGRFDDRTQDAIRLLTKIRGLIADPVYEAKAVRGLLDIAKDGHFRQQSTVL